MAFIETKLVLKNLKSALETLKFPEGSPFAGTSVFAQVEFFDVENLKTAIKNLITVKNSLCVVVPLPERYKTTQSGTSIKVRKNGEFLVLITDKSYGINKGNPLFFGDDETPGVLHMWHAVVTQLIGETLGIDHVAVVASEGEPLRFAENEKNIPQGRQGFRGFFDINMGSLRASLTPGTKISDNV